MKCHFTIELVPLPKEQEAKWWEAMRMITEMLLDLQAQQRCAPTDDNEDSTEEQDEA